MIRLGAPGTIRRIDVDTRHFKGNAPGACGLEACRVDDETLVASAEWQELLPRTLLQPHARHTFEEEVRDIGTVSHVRFNIYPDGGVGRLRLYGKPAPPSAGHDAAR
jgi:allantoicase